MQRAFLYVLCAIITGAANAGDQLILRQGVLQSAELLNTAFQPLDFTGVSTANQLWILQFKSPMELSRWAKEKPDHIEIFRYLPEDAFVIRANSASVGALKQRAGVVLCEPYLPKYRVATSFQPLSVFNKENQQKFLVVFFSDPSKLSLDLGNLRVLSRGKKNLLVSGTLKNIEKISNWPDVEWVEPYQPLQLFNMPFADDIAITTEGDSPLEYTGYESGTKLMNFEKAWKQGLTGKGEIVAVADTGLDTGQLKNLHKDFGNRVLQGFAHGLFTDSWADSVSHGTHVTASVAGSGLASGGKLKGGAFEANIIAQGMWSGFINPPMTIPTEVAVIFDEARDHGARIHSNSWGREANGAYDNYSQQVDEYVFNNPESLIVFAAGNSGKDIDGDGRVDAMSLGSPSTAKNALTVGASENLISQGGLQDEVQNLRKPSLWTAEPIASDRISNNANGIAAFSSRGPTADGRIKPDVVAPGTNIVSLCSSLPETKKLWGAFNEDYCFAGGTSMSTPLTAAAAAVVRQHLKKQFEKPSAALIKAALMHSAVDLYPGQFGAIGEDKGQELLVPGANSNQGFGRVDVAAAVSDQAQFIDEKEGLATGESKTYPAPAGTRRVTLVYSDAPSALAAAKNLVNDLDIMVTFTDGTQTELKNTVDNHEHLYLPADSAKEIEKIKVIARSVPQGRQGKQAFALVFSAAVP